ncbi:hypothetical protein BFP77_08385 [Maribacter sp. 4U21]|uniref:hypothetical protein n=1 Tax=Maribacter sp. 4U21 TaxID=1889779 RepID=UPI000C1603F0|nr:hypothetical protein [Maribacter sp. 4U21]PIB28925.1 hypothetical protein BFP77_08385 [Maribacter sp. 4U21]
MIDNETIMYLIGANAFALMALYFIVWMKFRKIKADREMELTDVEYQLRGQIQTLGRTAKEWDDQRKLEIKALEETTLKAKEAENGELIITSPDGKTKIDEFKLAKGK